MQVLEGKIKEWDLSYSNSQATGGNRFHGYYRCFHFQTGAFSTSELIPQWQQMDGD